MKRMIVLALALLLLLPYACLADTWDCVCGETGNQWAFCENCGRSMEEGRTVASGPATSEPRLKGIREFFGMTEDEIVEQRYQRFRKFGVFDER